MTREELIEETKRERALEQIDEYLRSLDVVDLFEIIPDIFMRRY
ncbi:MAG: hypothetical protein U5K00_21215 [Melioribacteraceae bacterium]|nr:hypothetical protein [Melioribacteraceae bacterium]